MVRMWVGVSEYTEMVVSVRKGSEVGITTFHHAPLFLYKKLGM